MNELAVRPGGPTLAELRAVLGGGVERIIVDPADWSAVDAGRVLVERVVAEGRRTYGVNTGFGPLSSRAIPTDMLAEMQRRMIESHCVGTGPLLDDGVVRAAIVLKVAGLLSGRSGVRRDLVTALVGLFNAGIVPAVPAKGSVGASGDLAPLAHIAAAVLGIGEVRVDGTLVGADEALAGAGLRPFVLAPKEGLALVNGTQVSLALAVAGLVAAERVFAAAVLAGALSTEAILGSEMPFDPRIHAARGQPGQERLAHAYASLLAGSGIQRSDRRSGRVQDPYSIRCQPQIMGAAHDLISHAAGVFERELGAITDNPLVFAEDDEVLYGGNFHGQPVAMAADVLALAIAEVGSMSERRLALLVDANLSGLPPFLAADPGLDSGFMLAQVAAAALASENKALAHPVSIDSLPTSANQEDVVSMATHAARRLGEMADNAAAIVAYELLAASQGIELRRPLRSSARLEEAVSRVRARIPAYTRDRFLKPDVDAACALVVEGVLLDLVPADILPSFAWGVSPGDTSRAPTDRTTAGPAEGGSS